MAPDGKVQEYYTLSLRYLAAAKNNLEEELFEPAMSNGIHALELAIKSALVTVIDDPMKTHNVGGLFGRFFLQEVGEDTCKEINYILNKYNFPRYPGEDEVIPDDVEDDIGTITKFIENEIFQLINQEKK